MEILLAIIAIIWFALPFPLCIYLLKQHKKQQKSLHQIKQLLNEERAKEEILEKSSIRENELEVQSKEETPKSLPLKEIVEPIHVDPDIERLRQAAKAAQTGKKEFSEERNKEKANTTSKNSEGRSESPFIRLSKFLLQIGLLPPKENRGLESGLIPWALPRIGGILGILASLFFAVYVGKNTQPWIRFIELLCANIAVFVASFFLYKKNLSKIASVVEGMGLSMLYLCSVSAYAAKPVKVIDNLLLGIAIQVLTISAIFAWSYLKDRKTPAHIAVIFAYISATFSAFEGLREAALFLAFFTYIASVLSLKLKDWKALIQISIIGVYLPVLAFSLKDITSLSQLPHPYSISVFIALSLSLLPFAQIKFKNVFTSGAQERIFQAINTTLALGIGYTFYRNFHPDLLTQFYGVFCAIFAIWSIPFYFSKEKSFAFHLFFNKSAALLALFLVNKLEGDLAWYSLCIELLILIPLVRRKANAWVLIAPAGLIAYALWLFFFQDYIAMPDTYSFKWGLYISAPSIILIAIARMAPVFKKKEELFNLLSLSSLVPVAWLLFCLWETQWNQHELIRALCLSSFVCLLLCLSTFLAQKIFFLPICLLSLCANITFWDSPYKSENLLSLIAISAIILVSTQKQKSRDKFIKAFHALDLSFGAVCIISFCSWLETYNAIHYTHLAYPLLSIALLIGAKRIPAFADLSLLPLLIYLLQEPEIDLLGVFILMTILIISYLNACFCIQQSERFFWLKNIPFRTVCTLFVCAVILHNIATKQLTDPHFCGYFITLGIFQCLWLEKINPKLNQTEKQTLFITSAVFLAMALFPLHKWWTQYLSGYNMADFPWTYEWLTMGSLSACSWLFLSSYCRKTTNQFNWTKQTLWTTAILFYGCIIGSYNFPYIQLESFLTPILAFSCILLITLGFILKIKAYRLTGVFGLLYPIYRLFLYDIDETVYRIIAFAILSLLLIAVGATYHKYIHQIEE